MSRTVGTVSRGLRAPIIREGDDLIDIVTQSVLNAARSPEDGFTVQIGRASCRERVCLLV